MKDWRKHIVIATILLLELLPLYMMLQISFKDNEGFIANQWLPAPVGEWQWENYRHALAIVLPYLANTVVVTVATVAASLGLAILAAYFFARYEVPFSGLLWALFLFLMLMPGIANIVPLFSLLRELNLLNTLLALIVVGVAGAQVFNIFVLRSFIEDLPRELFEAAEIDGARHIHQILHIVIPMCSPIIGTLAVLLFIREWNEYLLPLIIMRDEELYTLGVGLIYLDGEYVKQWGQIMAAYTVASLPLIILFAFTMRLFIRGLTSGGIKG